MNKKLLSLAVATGVAGLGSGSAMAVDFTIASPVPDYVATEFTIAGAGTVINRGTNGLFDAGFSIDDTNERYIRFDIAGGAWAAQQTANDLVVNDSTGAGNGVESYSAGGATTDSFVIFAITASGGGGSIAPSNDVVFTPNGGITVTGQDPVSLTYQLFETAAAAVANAGGALATDSGTLIAFTAGNTTAAQAVTPNAIDVTVGTNTGAVFVGSNTNTIGAFNTSDSTLGPTNDTGTVANTAALEASSTLTVTGDFTFIQDAPGGTPDGTYTVGNAFLDITSAACGAGIQNATSVNDTTAVFNTSAIGADVAWVCVNANGVSLIAEQTFAGTYASVANTGYGNESSALTLGTLAKNGATDNTNLALTPGGAFANFLRVSNTSNIAGEVTFQVTDDAGNRVSGISLGSIAGQSSATLGGQASTSLIDINDLHDAAQAADSSFDAGTGKLRVSVTGNFQSIDLQTITVSTDNTTFATF